MKKLKKSLAICCVIIMMASLCLPAAAYSNGSKSIYNNSGVKLGFAEMWTYNATSGKVLYSQTTSSEIQNYVAAQSLIKGMTGWSIKFAKSDIMYNTNKKLSPMAALSIESDIVPVDARVIGGINTSVVGLCMQYNNGEGLNICSEGNKCNFADDLLND